MKEKSKSKQIYEARLRRMKYSGNNLEDVPLINNIRIKKRKLKAFPTIWNSSIFLTGGLGDTITVESFLTNSQRESIETIYYATRQFEPLKELINSSNIFPKLKNNINLWKESNDFWCFFSIADFLKKEQGLNSKIKLGINNSKDLSILVLFKEIKDKKIKYNNSSFLKKEICNVKNFKLPKEYIVVAPYSTDKRNKNRDFTQKDWEKSLNFCKKNNMKCVVINKGNGHVPQNRNVINLNNQTNVIEAIEILKQSSGYLGIDSWLSVLAAKLFDENFLQIKSDNEHLLNNLYCYYAPKQKFDFIKNNIEFF